MYIVYYSAVNLFIYININIILSHITHMLYNHILLSYHISYTITYYTLGKSTLLKMIAAGELKVPPRVDYLYVEQEVLADDTSAVDAVLKADKIRWNLIMEEKQLLKELEVKQDDVKDTRLGEVYELLNQIGK